jgi:hypothetical protein
MNTKGIDVPKGKRTNDRNPRCAEEEIIMLRDLWSTLYLSPEQQFSADLGPSCDLLISSASVEVKLFLAHGKSI